MIYSRHTDYEHYVKCQCGWEGWSAQMRHDYQSYNVGGEMDVEPMDFCPECGESEMSAEAFVTCIRRCEDCQDRYLCWSLFKRIPTLNTALIIIPSEVKNG
ncbi:MAG: hypothetical protein WC196_06065 [Bacilli bacterium]|jgi:uncharacterized protein (DUF983 family)